MERRRAIGDGGGEPRPCRLPDRLLEALGRGPASEIVAPQGLDNRTDVVLIDVLVAVSQNGSAHRGAALYGKLLHTTPP